MFAHGHLAAGGPPGGSPVIGSPMFLHGDPPLTQQVPSRGTAREASAELGSCCCVKGLTRSTMMTTDTSATVVSRVAYTAFGDPVTPDGQGGWRVGWPVDLGTRYQYDGGWGYESGGWGPGPGGQGAVGGPLALWGENPALPPVTLQHVGWRWYQPSIGRFVQRDRVGLAGGMNVYAYLRGSPLLRVDRDGLGGQADKVMSGILGGYAGYQAAVAGGPVFVVAAGGIVAGKSAGELLVEWTPIEDWIGYCIAAIFMDMPTPSGGGGPRDVDPSEIPCGPHY